VSETVNVNIMGMPFSLRAGDNPEYILGLAEYVDGLTGELQANSPKLSQQQVAVLTALNLADMLSQAKMANSVIDEANERLRSLLNTME
jgi:cell division protein ZapA (FtsZ GTPase activity inhibitor)